MLRVMSVVGTRPQFVKAAMVSRAIVEAARAGKKIVERIVHTGQHYDRNMDAVFFEDLGIPEPCANIHVGSGLHGETTAKMLAGIEKEIIGTRPDVAIIYGDTNSALAGALAASKLHVPVAHVEAGLRSFNRAMAEEINRVIVDHVAELLFCPTIEAIENLRREGIEKGVHHTGDVMFDAAKIFGEIGVQRSTKLAELGLAEKGFYLVTMHRAENVDDRARLGSALEALRELAKEAPVVFPVHPRTRARIKEFALDPMAANLTLIEPLSFIDMARLQKAAKAILTDSGGVQKEGYFHGTPVVTLRDETEWVETVSAGWNTVVGVDPEKIVEAARNAGPGKPILEYGSGKASEIIVDLLIEKLS
ncbi:MAG: UDP-N-acetylglucosamine 2-epimerase (non-hydrolyzing) [Planctomycetes bacterium]|nr:UDP-N-acetylglucosamine 2-epimerase (non-hydrolyzing) [Planctomycetota bacterium]